MGNFIFQFPVTILNVKTKVASDSWDSLEFSFNWHHSLENDCPECILEVDSILDKNYIGNAFEEYNKMDSQEVFVGNVDSLTNVKIWRKDPKLLLYSNSCHYIKSIGLGISFDLHKKRYFINNGEDEFVRLNSMTYEPIINKQEYYQYVENSVSIQEKKILEDMLSFKQYTPEHGKSEGLADLRRLIKENGRYGVYLWDPYLTFEEIINTLFYCPFEGVELRALGAVNKKVRTIYSNDSIKNKIGSISEKINLILDSELSVEDSSNLISSIRGDLDDIEEYSNSDDEHFINEQKNNFLNLNSNFKGLNLEFRVQKGKGAHDRFLIFPGNSKTYHQPKVYSLGTSLNSFGKNYHILQEVLHPQAVLYEFNKIWDESKGNIIWKHQD